jgi:hypothetical protein
MKPVEVDRVPATCRISNPEVVAVDATPPLADRLLRPVELRPYVRRSIERDWLTLLEAAWLLQVREHVARGMVASDLNPEGRLKPYPGSGARVKVTAESLRRLLRGKRALVQFERLLNGLITAPAPECRGASPKPFHAQRPIDETDL